MFMHAADDRAIGFCGAEAVSTVSLPNAFPEIAQHADSVRLFSFEITKTRYPSYPISLIELKISQGQRWALP